jgi:hypothetical protein
MRTASASFPGAIGTPNLPIRARALANIINQPGPEASPPTRASRQRGPRGASMGS